MTRKYNLPKYICFDVRSSLCSKKVIYDITLVKNDGKRHSTKTTTVREGMNRVIENRKQYAGWTQADIDKYNSTYDPSMENQFTLQDACDKTGVSMESVLDGSYVKQRYGKPRVLSNLTAPVKEEEVKSNEEVLTSVNDNKEEDTKKSNIIVMTDAEKEREKEYLEYLRNHPQWFNITNFPDYQIYSEPYYYTNEYGVTCSTYHIRKLISKKELQPSTKTNSLYVTINGISKAIYKLAADTFLHNPYKKRDSELVATEVHHLNGDHSDNRLENLKHVTKEEHAMYHKEMNANKPRKILTFNEVMQIRAEYNKTKSAYLAAQSLGLSTQVVFSAIRKTEEQLLNLLKKDEAFTLKAD